LNFDDIEYCEEYIQDCQEIRENHNYDNMPLEEKFKVWDLELTQDDILLMQEVVVGVRGQLNNLWEEKQKSIEFNRKLMDLHTTVANMKRQGLSAKPYQPTTNDE
jgi:hypothetical protein